MIKLDITKEKKMIFYVSISGVDFSTLNAFYRIEVNDIEYGFKCIIKQDKIECLVPPIRDVVGRINSGEILNSRLDVYNNNECFVVWSGELETRGDFNINVKNVSDGKVNITSTRKAPVVTDDFNDEELDEDDDFSADDEDVIIKPKNNIKKTITPVVKSSMSPQNKTSNVSNKVINESKTVPVAKPKKKLVLTEDNVTDEFMKKFLVTRGVTNNLMQENMIMDARKHTAHGRNLETLQALNEITRGWK